MKARVYKRNILSMTRKMPKIMVVFLVLFALATIFLAIESFAQGAQLVGLESKEAQIESQNEELRSQLVTSTSLSKISDEAQQMGMIVPGKLIYINGEKPVANRVP